MGIRHQNLWACRSPDLTESLAHHGFMLGRVLLVLQAPRLDGPFFDLRSPFDDGRVPPEVGVGGCYVFDALVITTVVVVIHECLDLMFEVAGQVVVFQQGPVFERLMPAFDLTLCLWVVRCAPDMAHFLIP